MKNFENIYTSAACNRTPESADWGDNNLVIFAACNAVALLDLNFDGSAKIIQTFVEHTAKVNTVKWISKTRFLSGAYDNLCILWNIENRTEPQILKFVGHVGGVTFVDAIEVAGKLTVATTSLDSTIRLWHWSEAENQFVTFDSISLGNGFCFALKFAILPETKDKIVLAHTTDDSHIHLLVDGVDVDGNRKFTRVDTLVGHVDWVRSLDFVSPNENELILASSSQDTFIRLWKISSRPTVKQVRSNYIQVEEKIFSVVLDSGNRLNYAVSLESVLSGHEGWIYSVQWGRTETKELLLLSSSMDKTVIAWSIDFDGVWREKVRVGEIGGNTLGFYGAKFSPQCKSILGHGYQGSFHLWHFNEARDFCNPGVIVGGHFNEVRDLSWEPFGQFLLTTSADQTTRCHAPWIRSKENQVTWHELARPQVHGYDMQTICMLSRYRFASGAEEKIVRTFQAPGNFVQNFRRICSISDDKEGDDVIESLPKGAAIPSLGLSNKAVYDETIVPSSERHVKDAYPENYFVSITLNEPPTEETLMQNTLWPEVQKLYGHGYELFALGSTSDGKILASSCRATNEEHARIILWNTTTWKQVQKLSSHQLTVTQMKFSPNDRYLLSVSRDRRWSLFEREAIEDSSSLPSYKLVASTDKKNGAHARIIWTCDWTHDSKFFATGSRDGKLVAWTRTETDSKSSLGHFAAVDTFEFSKTDSITAFSFATHFSSAKNDYLAAVGFENGSIQLMLFNGKWTKLFSINQNSAHHSTIKKLSFRPTNDEHELASCGDDHFVRIYKIKE